MAYEGRVVWYIFVSVVYRVYTVLEELGLVFFNPSGEGFILEEESCIFRASGNTHG